MPGRYLRSGTQIVVGDADTEAPRRHFGAHGPNPPAPPAGLNAATAPNSIEISWEGNTEPDLAGYRVYRSTGAGPFEKIGDLVVPSYSDRAVEHGKTYRYAVSAIDKSGNESARSGPVEATLQ